MGFRDGLKLGTRSALLSFNFTEICLLACFDVKLQPRSPTHPS